MSTPTALEAPYAIQRRYKDDKYYRTFNAARKAVLADLGVLLTTWRTLGITDSQEAVRDLVKYVEEVAEGPIVRVDGVIDPHTQMRYTAMIVRRGDDQ